MLKIFVKCDLLCEIIHISVNTDSGKAALACVGKYLLVHTLLPTNNRRKHHKPCALGEHQDTINDLVEGLLADFLATDGTMGHANTGIEQTKVIVYFGYCTNGGTWVLGGGLLVDGNGRRETLDKVNVGLIHLTDKHSRIGGKALNEASVTLGIEGVKGQGGLSATRKTGQNNQLVTRNCYRNIL